MADIYHIARRADWDEAAASGTYAPKSLEHEGFIHCSKRWQLLDVANSRYRGQEGLVLLQIDTDQVVPEIRNEDCYDTGKAYPHVYGALATSVVTAVLDFPPGGDGTFSLPPEIA